MSKYCFSRLGQFIAIFLVIFAAVSAQALSPSYSVTDSSNPHNLSAGGSGVFQADTERRVCIVCHTPHHASKLNPLWSHQTSSADYTPYDSTTLATVQKPDQPLGASRLCLACHDGTVALGMLVGGGVVVGGLEQPLPPFEAATLGTDLSDDHPISFLYNNAVTAGAELNPLPFGLPLEEEKVECTSCHDPHLDRFPPLSKPAESGKFLRLDNYDKSSLCLACHNPQGWVGAAHDLFGDVCGNCHQPHTAAQPPRLLRGSTAQDTCLQRCHNGVGSGANITATLVTAQAHQPNSGTLAGNHDAAENPQTFDPNLPHVECIDCHSPHRSRHETIPLNNPPHIDGGLEGVVVARNPGEPIRYAETEYEICFKCHGERPFVPVAKQRQVETNDQSLRFDLANPSFHPVLGPGRSPNVPSLRPGLSEASLIYCTDCHNNPDGTKGGGVEANGPHGSIYEHLLIGRYEQDVYPQPYSQDAYALCFRCHDPAILLASPVGTAFQTTQGRNLHDAHIRIHRVPCSVCHDPHGTALAAGATSAANSHLINFDIEVVDFNTASYDSELKECFVSCHHANPRNYR